MKAKVESSSNYIIKYNTARFSSGLEWFTEFFSINHKRELRVYSWYAGKSHKALLLPESYELTSKHIKIEKLIELEESEIRIPELIPSINEFILLGIGQKRNVFDFLSSPTQSVLRGLIRNARFLGVKLIFQALKNLFLLYSNKPRINDMFLIHKDLKKDQNMIATKNGVYFIDFGSSILTKNYFLTDIVELSTDHVANTVNFYLIQEFIEELGVGKYNIQHLRSQIYLLLLRRYLHFHPIDRANKLKMEKARYFLGNLDSLVCSFEIRQKL
jgi:hypothetical protein